MTSKLQKNYLGSFEHSAKIDSKIWNDIKTFFTENYSEYSIILTLEDKSTQKYTDFDSAKDFIIKNDNRIKKIRLFAEEGEEIIKIDYVTGMWTKQSAISSEANHVKDNYAKVSEFHIKLRDKSKTDKRKTISYIGFLILPYYILDNVFDYFGINIVKTAPQIFVIAALCIAVIAASYEIAWGKKKVHFLFNEDSKKQYRKTKRRNNTIVISLGVILLIVWGLTIALL